jgi:hypothetical protein
MIHFKKSRLPAWSLRLLVAFGGLAIAAYGLSLLHRNVLVFQGMNQRQTIYSPGIIASGLLVMALALIPNSVVRCILSGRPTVRPDKEGRRRHSES